MWTRMWTPSRILNAWYASSYKQDERSQRFSNFHHVDHNPYHDDNVERQVGLQHIMATAAKSLSKGNSKPGAFPFKYVYKGSDHK